VLVERLVPQRQFSQLQSDFEKAVHGFKVALDPQERKVLLHELRKLIDEADRMLLDDSSK
jgi:hypothetical protein